MFNLHATYKQMQPIYPVELLSLRLITWAGFFLLFAFNFCILFSHNEYAIFPDFTNAPNAFWYDQNTFQQINNFQ